MTKNVYLTVTQSNANAMIICKILKAIKNKVIPLFGMIVFLVKTVPQNMCPTFQCCESRSTRIDFIWEDPDPLQETMKRIRYESG